MRSMFGSCWLNIGTHIDGQSIHTKHSAHSTLPIVAYKNTQHINIKKRALCSVIIQSKQTECIFSSVSKWLLLLLVVYFQYIKNPKHFLLFCFESGTNSEWYGIIIWPVLKLKPMRSVFMCLSYIVLLGYFHFLAAFENGCCRKKRTAYRRLKWFDQCAIRFHKNIINFIVSSYYPCALKYLIQKSVNMSMDGCLLKLSFFGASESANVRCQTIVMINIMLP